MTRVRQQEPELWRRMELLRASGRELKPEEERLFRAEAQGEWGLLHHRLLERLIYRRPLWLPVVAADVQRRA